MEGTNIYFKCLYCDNQLFIIFEKLRGSCNQCFFYGPPKDKKGKK